MIHWRGISVGFWRPAEDQNGSRDDSQLFLGRLRGDPEHRPHVLRVIIFSLVAPVHSGMFPCLRLGTPTRLEIASRRALISHGRVILGSITSSMYPRDAAW